MLLDGAHDSRAGYRRARGAETGRPRERWSAVPRVGQPFARPASKPHGPPRDCPRGRSRFVSTRTDSSAYGYEPLADFAQPVQTSKTQLRHPNCLSNLRLQTAPNQTALYTLSQITAEAAERETARVTSRYIEIYEAVVKCPFSPRTRRWLPWKKPRPGSRTFS